MNKKILVTGGAGYVGSSLVPALLSHGYEVRVLDKLVYGDFALESVKNRIELVVGDILNPPENIMDGIFGVIHLAGLSTEPTANINPRLTDQINHIGVEKIARLAKEHGVERFIFASSCSVYFTYDTPLIPPPYKEDESVNSISAYSISKKAAEEALKELTDDNFKPIIFRKGTLFGFSPKMRYDLVLNSFTKDAFKQNKIIVHAGGEIYRPMLDIKHAVAAYISALELPLSRIGDKIFNIVDDNIKVTNLAQDFIKIIKDYNDINIVLDIQEVGIARNYLADNTRYKEFFIPKKERQVSDAIIEMWQKLTQGHDYNDDRFYTDKWHKKINEEKIKKTKILIVGAAGQLGQALNKIFNHNYELYNLSHQDVDITDFNKLQEKITEIKPNIIINPVAFHQVEECEQNVAKSYLVNSLGAFNISKLAHTVNATIIYLSTDYVFDGIKTTGYEEHDSPNPINVYGASKLAGEQLTALANYNHYIIRTSALFSEFKSGKGHNFIDLMLNLAQKEEKIEVVNDQYTCPTYVSDLVFKIKEMIEKKIPYGVYHVTNQGFCSWYELAKTIFEIKGLNINLTAINTDSDSAKAQRPKFSVLLNNKLTSMGLELLPPWSESLKKFLSLNQNHMENSMPQEKIARFHEQRFHEDARRRGFYDLVPGLPGDMNFTHMQANIISGMHMHKNQTDYFTVAKGSVLFRLVAEDGREERVVLSEHSRKTLIISPGVWHGYRSLEPSILVFYIDQKFNLNDENRRPTSAADWQIEIK
ncbi:MAG TPA: dTDP-4-dehydrorhamnose reductase [bacterium]|nr:dTDP-4-dehydrorhamnose reductase [bacterium]